MHLNRNCKDLVLSYSNRHILSSMQLRYVLNEVDTEKTITFISYVKGIKVNTVIVGYESSLILAKFTTINFTKYTKLLEQLTLNESATFNITVYGNKVTINSYSFNPFVKIDIIK